MTEQERWEEISDYSQSYYEGHPDISDAEFDILYDNFIKDFPNSTHIKEVAKGFNVDNTTLQKFKHKYSTVGSISKIHSIEETNFTAPFFYNISVKLDGSSLVLYYVDGQLERALTRGDGLYGLDVTNKVKYLCPEALTPKFFHEKPFTGAVRGEVVMSNCAFEEYKKEHPEAKMARNVSTGLMMRKDISEELKYCDYIAYKILAVENDAMLEWWLPEVHLQLKNWGFKVVTSVNVEGETITDDLMSQLKQREDFNTYPTDGLVIESCNLTSDEDGIVTYAEVAYKFAAETKACKVIDVKWNFSPKGKLVPVVQIEPTMMSGALVSNVSGFNYKFIMDNNIGPGAEITVCRSGEVIPDIQSVTKPSSEVTSPYVCPECGELLELTKTGVDLICSNPNCTGRKFYNKFTFIEKMAEDIKGFGEVLIQQLITELTNNSSDPVGYTEAELFEDIKNADDKFYLETFTPANAAKCIKLKELFNKPMNKEKFLKALNVDLLGEVAAKQIANDSKLFNAIFYTNKSELLGQMACYGLAPVLSNNIIKNLYRIRKFTGLNWEEHKEINKFVAITGSLSKPRKEFEQDLAKYGYGITDNLNKAEFLITNDPNSGSSKNEKAKKLGVETLTEKDFWVKLN